MSKFFQVAGEEGASDLSSSDEESLYGRSVDEDSSSESDLGSGSASDSDSASGDEADSGDEEDNEGQPRNAYLRSSFLKGGKGADSDNDSGDEKIVVKSAKTKVLDEIVSESESFMALLTSRDWVSALSTFDKLVKVQEKANKQYAMVPLEFVQALTRLDEVLREKNTKKLSPSQSKSQNTLRQRQKKFSKEYAQRLELCSQDPNNYTAALPILTVSSETTKKKPAYNSKTAPSISPSTPLGDELSSATVFRTLLSVVESRGKKNTDRHEQASLLERQLGVAETPYQKISIYLMLIPLRFDLNSSAPLMSSTLYAGADFGPWEQIERDLRNLFEIVESQSEYVIIESAVEPEDLEAGPQPGINGKRQIPGSLPTLVERLDDEHARILATYDPHTTEYIERLRDETKLGDLILRAQCHQEAALAALELEPTSSEAYCRLLGRRIDHLYYKPAVAIAATECASWARVPSQLNTVIGPRVIEPAQVDAVALISQLCSVLYKQGNTLLRARAVLSLIYQYALSDEYYKARDLMLMSHLQSQIHSAEPATQVLFNRSLVQVGLCAFRAGFIQDALQSLQEICGPSRLKELLGQGQARQQPQQQSQVQQSGDGMLTPGFSAPELLPYHMHINLELVECVYLTASMLTEVPYLANIADMRSAQLDLKRRAVNRPFRRLLDSHDRQVFLGPSETTRDYVIQAAKSLQIGDWHTAHDLLGEIRVWGLLSPQAGSRDKILAMLEQKLKVEGLRTYLLTYGSQAYHSVSLKFLSEEFELQEVETRRLIIKMIAGDEITALLDTASKNLVFKAEADVSRLQTLAMALADKAAQLAERNERLAADGHNPDQASKRQVRVRN